MIRRSRSVVSSCCSACRALITIRVCAISGSAGCYVGAVRRSESRQHRCRLPPWPGAPFRQRWPAPPRRRVARGVQKWSAKVRSAECGVPRQRFVCLRERDGARGGRGGGGTRWRPRLYCNVRTESPKSGESDPFPVLSDDSDPSLGRGGQRTQAGFGGAAVRQRAHRQILCLRQQLGCIRAGGSPRSASSLIIAWSRETSPPGLQHGDGVRTRAGVRIAHACQ